MISTRTCAMAALLASAVAVSSAQRPSPRGVSAGEWIDYAGDTYGLKYSPLSQIDKDNVRDLRVAWRWATADRDIQKSDALLRGSRYQDTPLMVNGVLYTGTPLGMVAALDPG